MSTPDLNLLVALDALLTEGNVARAAVRLRLSPSAMSRTLARLRDTLGDPLLVRAGRGLVPTPRARELRDHVCQLVEAARAALRPAETPDLGRLTRTFSLRTREGFVETFGLDLIARVRAEAPGVRLRFAQKLDKDSTPLRDGSVDLETGVLGKTTGPEVRAQALFQDHFVGVVREGHPLSRGELTRARYASGEHVQVARRTVGRGPVEDALESFGIERQIVTTVGTFSAALALVRGSDLIATVPGRYTGALRAGMRTFPLPFPTPKITISLMWHPRMDADPVHRWLRQCVREVCALRLAGTSEAGSDGSRSVERRTRIARGTQVP